MLLGDIVRAYNISVPEGFIDVEKLEESTGDGMVNGSGGYAKEGGMAISGTFKQGSQMTAAVDRENLPDGGVLGSVAEGGAAASAYGSAVLETLLVKSALNRSPPNVKKGVAVNFVSPSVDGGTDSLNLHRLWFRFVAG